MGVALILTGLGFGVMALGLLPPRRTSESTVTSPATKAEAIPAA